MLQAFTHLGYLHYRLFDQLCTSVAQCPHHYTPEQLVAVAQCCTGSGYHNSTLLEALSRWSAKAATYKNDQLSR